MTAFAGPFRPMPILSTAIGPWTVGASRDASGLYDGCVASRRIADISYSIHRNGAGIGLQLLSEQWQLEETASYPVLLVGNTRIDETVVGRVLERDRIELRLGDADRAATIIRSAGPFLDIRTATVVIHLPVDEAAAALRALDDCWKGTRQVAANPFAARAAGSAALNEPDPKAEGLIEQQVFFDAEIDGEVVRLDGTVVKPSGEQGRLPIALITHGTTGDRGEMSALRSATMLPQARDLAHRGYLAVAVARRGYGLSQGPARNAPSSCSRPGFAAAFDSDAAELASVLRIVQQRPDADSGRAIAIGVSGGGGAVLALAARNPAGLVASVNISGGLNLIRDDGSHCDVAGELARTVAQLGGKTRVPSLWIYAENDSFFAPELVARLYSAFRSAGGVAELSMLGAIGVNGHDIFATPQGRYHWLPSLDDFLREQSLPTWDLQEVDAVLREGGIDPGQRSWVLRYLSAPTQKVLVASRTGRSVRLRFGQADQASARAAALGECEAAYDTPCRVVMGNFGHRPEAEETALLKPQRGH